MPIIIGECIIALLLIFFIIAFKIHLIYTKNSFKAECMAQVSETCKECEEISKRLEVLSNK